MFKWFKSLGSVFGLLRANEVQTDPLIDPKPKHVAVIMDGNGRWANSRGLSRVAGHKKGVDAVKALIRGCIQHEIPYLSIFAFSSENWNRPQSEVTALMDLFATALKTQTEKLDENQICLNLLGDMSKFDERIRKLAEQAQALTRNNHKLVLNVAVNYGGRWDIVQAGQKLAERVQAGELAPEQITEEHFSQMVCTHGQPDPDLFIRTSGEYRLSNFFLWQAAYAEFHFTDVLWPDFNEASFTEALLTFKNRERRFGNAIDSVDVEGVAGHSDVREVHQEETRHA